jgi:hypothetical protein
MRRRHLRRDINRRQKWRTMSPLVGLRDVGRLLTRGSRPWLQHVAPLGLKVVARCRLLSRCDFRRQASIGCKSLADRDLLRRPGPCRLCDATVRATELATVVRWKRALVVSRQVSGRRSGAETLARSVSGRREAESPASALGLVAKELVWSFVHYSGVRGQKQSGRRGFIRLLDCSNFGSDTVLKVCC